MAEFSCTECGTKCEGRCKPQKCQECGCSGCLEKVGEKEAKDND